MSPDELAAMVRRMDLLQAELAEHRTESNRRHEQTEDRLDDLEARRERSEVQCLELQGEYRSGQKAILAKLEELTKHIAPRAP